MEYKVVLEAFEGPLDLLLHLIEKEKVDIYDIPIAKITDQYIEYINNMESVDLNMTSEFLLMAATLLEIKSKMLLPSNSSDDEEQLEFEEVDPREELVRKLLEYKKYKIAAEKLKMRADVYSRVFFKRKEELEEFLGQDSLEIEKLDFKDLLLAYLNLLNKSNINLEEIKLTEIQRDEITIEECMKNLENIIREKKKVKFEELFNEKISKIKIVVTFLAILELAKLKIIKIAQENNFGEIIIKSCALTNDN